jgi:hypothetical protein
MEKKIPGKCRAFSVASSGRRIRPPSARRCKIASNSGAPLVDGHIGVTQ